MGIKKYEVLAISGSTKSSSTSLSFLTYIKHRFMDRINLIIYDDINSLPHFNPDLESNLPESVVALRSQIDKADGVLFCTPEYVFSLPGSFKNILEWNVSTVLLAHKPVAMIIAAASGKYAFSSLEMILNTLDVSMPDSSKLLIQGAKGKIGKKGNIEDQSVVAKIDLLANSFFQDLDKKKI